MKMILFILWIHVGMGEKMQNHCVDVNKTWTYYDTQIFYINTANIYDLNDKINSLEKKDILNGEKQKTAIETLKEITENR